MLIVLIYLIVFIIQFFSPLWFQLLLMRINFILLMRINFILPDNIPIADEIIQSIILINKIAKTTKKDIPDINGYEKFIFIDIKF
ncbi:hypothetical protein [Leptotrichia trevisanii]|uniref:Uncharacterized protein n=1 Tax=Leptotrichia trevisanii TaxID=109328 RepID=A0A510K346_9FUSO|nr:hypothetical protein [Leptotrichia trevisanii]BBM44233.1 hypothetical protein JMUB3870_0340 [Leptotrichia trevisanii]